MFGLRTFNSYVYGCGGAEVSKGEDIQGGFSITVPRLISTLKVLESVNAVVSLTDRVKTQIFVPISLCTLKFKTTLAMVYPFYPRSYI